jgi:hypothetical protein
MEINRQDIARIDKMLGGEGVTPEALKAIQTVKNMSAEDKANLDAITAMSVEDKAAFEAFKATRKLSEDNTETKVEDPKPATKK